MPSITQHDFWRSYCGIRYVTLSLRLTDDELAQCQHIATVLNDWCGLSGNLAAYYARRAVLFRRDYSLHQSFLWDLSPKAMKYLLDGVAVVGFDRLKDLDQGHGVLFITLHYSLYSNVLMGWLMRSIAQGIFKHLTILLVSNPTTEYVLTDSRLSEFEQEGLVSRMRVRRVDPNVSGTASSLRELVHRLNDGGTAWVLPDARLMSPRQKTLTISLGKRTIGLPRGAVWLARASKCAVLPVYIRPHAEDRYAVVIGTPIYPNRMADYHRSIQHAVQLMADETILVDPSPWDGWFRDRSWRAIRQIDGEHHSDKEIHPAA